MKFVGIFAVCGVLFDGCVSRTESQNGQPVSSFSDYDFTPDEVKATLKSAEGGDAPAAFDLFSYYSSVTLEQEKSIFWLRKSASLGLPKAQYTLGILCSWVPAIKDLDASRYWIEEAARNGYPAAIQYLNEPTRQP